ncbi:polyadenylate-binding protein-interacting protein 7-like isoform X2 [Canna indica]|uniref:Polyadenylate-binding protein-interacting protein 7-like isoform X2 n=1 Tax=Canna indica TaxID=4628 RepID=A0AAQ3K5Z0_9LILI|nr:polyadenylate-binding protein-interacting protein 7-like isoform X2 [Canna indica]
MNSSNKGLTDNKVAKLGALNKVTALNPNAAEFVPTSLKYTYGITKSSEAAELDLPGSSKRTALDRSVSNASNISDDEVHQYWHHQLPDDITPDFEAIGEEELNEPAHLTLANLSIQETVEKSTFSAPRNKHILDMHQDVSSLTSDYTNLDGKMGYPGSNYVNEQSSVASLTSASNMWGKTLINGEHQWKRHRNVENYNNGFVDDLIGDNLFPENSTTDPIEFLSLRFPSFAAQSLADVYYGNGCDLNLTIEILSHLEVDVGFGQNLNSNSLDSPNFSPLAFPSLVEADTQNLLPKYNGEDVRHGSSLYRSSSGISSGGIDFASTVRKLASKSSGHRRYERNGFDNGAVGSSRNSQLLSSSYNGNGNMINGDKWYSSGSAGSPVCLETGEAVANIYSESREEACDYARLRNTCFEQARMAHLIGNEVLAKELGSKGQLYNMQMKAAHEAKNTMYWKRNLLSPDIQSYDQGQNRLIDLHGLHVTEAIHVLNHELRILRNTARTTGQRLHFMIYVGTGHHTKGSRTLVRLPVAVEQYLLEEGIHYTQPQPGLLRIVIH